MNHRPYPDIDRALAQLERHQAAESEPHMLAFIDEVVVPLELATWQKAWLNAFAGVVYPKKSGKAAITAAITEEAVKAGQHVHVATARGVHCAGGDAACALPRLRPATPLVVARAVRTCTAVPSQWNAWTVDGQYLYLRYRSGIGTVDAYDSTDVETWAHVPDGQVAFFDTGDRQDGEMDLPEFCERAGLQLADDAEVIGE